MFETHVADTHDIQTELKVASVVLDQRLKVVTDKVIVTMKEGDKGA